MQNEIEKLSIGTVISFLNVAYLNNKGKIPKLVKNFNNTKKNFLNSNGFSFYIFVIDTIKKSCVNNYTSSVSEFD